MSVRLPRQEVGVLWTPPQWRFLSIVQHVARSPYPGPWKFVLLGGWGSGKTTAVSAAVGYWVMSLKGDPSNPLRFVCFGPTNRTLAKVVQPTLKKVIPRGAVRKYVNAPHPSWHLINGVQIDFVSNEADFEGENVAGLWVDEVHKLARQPDKWRNYVARARDKQAQRLAIFASGLPEAGWTRQTFDPLKMDDDELALSHTQLIGTMDNAPNLLEATLTQMRASCPAGFEDAFMGRGWMPVENAFYPQLSDENIVPDKLWDPRSPASFSLDIGATAAAVIGQERPLSYGHKRGLLVGYAQFSRNATVEEVCMRVKQTCGHQIMPGRSTIIPDPTIRADEEQSIRRVFPGVRILIRKRNDELYEVKPGERLLRAALLNADKQRHLHFCESVKHERELNIIEALEGTAAREFSEAKIKDDKRDHYGDALRYLVNHILGDRGFAPRAFKMYG